MRTTPACCGSSGSWRAPPPPPGNPPPAAARGPPGRPRRAPLAAAPPRSVQAGRRARVAHQASRAVREARIAKDPSARAAWESLVTTGMALVAGESTAASYVHTPDNVRGAISASGYADASFGFDAQ